MRLESVTISGFRCFGPDPLKVPISPGFTESTVAALLGHAQGTMTSRCIHNVGTSLIMTADTVTGYIAALLDGVEFKRRSYAVELRSRNFSPSTPRMRSRPRPSVGSTIRDTRAELRGHNVRNLLPCGCRVTRPCGMVLLGHGLSAIQANTGQLSLR